MTHLHARDKVSIVELAQDLGNQLAGQELENGISRGDVHIVSRVDKMSSGELLTDEIDGPYYPLHNRRANISAVVPCLFNGVQHVEQSSGRGALSPFSRELTTTRKSLP